jgi:bla regulator protein BlaR1
MAELIRYILLVNIFIIALSLFFRIFLEREKWFRTNRLVLNTGLLLALLIPLLQVDFVKTPEQALIVISEGINMFAQVKPDIILEEVQVIGNAPKVFPWIALFQILYLIGIIGMGLLLTWKLSRIRALQKANPMKLIRNLFITALPKGEAPFSFLGVAYLPEPILSDHEDSVHIMEHEKVHIKQRHSIDMLFMEFVKVLFFYNPAVYSLQHQLSLTHEYLVDAECATQNKKSYSMALFNSFFNAPEFLISSGFRSESMLKRRLLMLQTETQTRWAGLKYSLFVPLVGFFIALSAFTLVIP